MTTVCLQDGSISGIGNSQDADIPQRSRIGAQPALIPGHSARRRYGGTCTGDADLVASVPMTVRTLRGGGMTGKGGPNVTPVCPFSLASSGTTLRCSGPVSQVHSAEVSDP